MTMKTDIARRSLLMCAPLLAAPLALRAQATKSLNDRMTGYIGYLHDPVMIKEGDTYHVFGSGGWKKGALMTWRTSKDLVTWTDNQSPFDSLPDWTKIIVGGDCCWAPDISYVNGMYRLYYAISTGGSMRSAIGLAMSKTLDRSSPDYGWHDQGVVVETHPGDGHNAIDANFVADKDGKHWLAFGSYWTGLKLLALDPVTGKPLASDPVLRSLAYRPAPDGADNAIEAAFIYQHSGWYYLFASYDHCCRKMESDYYVACGRSADIAGPYIDREGRALMEGYGTSVIFDRPYKSHRYIGPGHCAVVRDGDRDLIVYHAYDTTQDALPTLRISPISWDADGWPSAVM